MSRDLEDENYYISNGGKIPVKWTAPEVSQLLPVLLGSWNSYKKITISLLGIAFQEVLNCQ